MKTTKYLYFFFIFSLSICAQQTSPQIEFKSTVIDYGIIENGGDGERIFNFKNIGNEELIITNVQSSCGCTIPKKPVAPIGPGKSGEIIVRYDTKRVGPFRKTIRVYTNQKNNQIVELKLKGSVLPIQ
jgi:hypothetical protein